MEHTGVLASEAEFDNGLYLNTGELVTETEFEDGV